MNGTAYVDAVLCAVDQIPSGRVLSYGDVAELVGAGGPRQVGQVMATHGGAVPWWRVVRADGSLPPSHDDRARQAYLEEGTPLRTGGSVDLRAAFWQPPPMVAPVVVPVVVPPQPPDGR